MHAHCVVGHPNGWSEWWWFCTLFTCCSQEREKVHWEEQRKAMQADQYNKAELAR